MRSDMMNNLGLPAQRSSSLVVVIGCAIFLMVSGACMSGPSVDSTPFAIVAAPFGTQSAAPESASTTPTESSSQTPSLTTRPSSTPPQTSTPTPTPRLLETTNNILVLGIDRRTGVEDPSWRTDTIMVLAVDHAEKRVGIVSIPRDLYVDIPGLGMSRINNADFYGHRTNYPGDGPGLLSRVLTETLGIPTSHFVRIQMDGLVRLVDTLGGVTLTLDCPLYERTPDETSPNGVIDWNLPAGEVHLDGADAKRFATYRYVTTDFGRAQRQQQLIWALRDRALQLDMIPRIPELWSAFQDTFQTNLDLVSVVRLLTLAVTLQPDAVHGMVFGPKLTENLITEEGSWVLVLKDRALLDEDLGQLFASQPLAALGHTGTAGCPPPPTALPTFTPTPTPTAPSAPTG